MKGFSMVLDWVMIFFYIAAFPFAMLYSCFKLATEVTDDLLTDALKGHIERRNK